MSWRIIALIVIMASLFSGCGETPEQEIQQSDTEAPVISETPETETEQVETEHDSTTRTETGNIDISGEWRTSLGDMILSMEGDKVTGEYPLGTLEGTLTEKRFDFTYNESGLEGVGWFEFSEDDNSFRGVYAIEDVEFVWEGFR